MLGNGRPAVSPYQRPVPIASVAKVMTAYVVLEHYRCARATAAGDSWSVSAMSWTLRRGAAGVSRLWVSARASGSPSGMP